METLSLILIPLIAAAFLLFVGKERKIFIKVFSFVSLTATSLALGKLLIEFNPEGGMQSQLVVPWLSTWGFNLSLGIDGISIPFLLLAAILGPIGLLYSTDIKEQTKEYHILYLILVGGAYGLFLSQNLFFIFFFLEFEILTAYFLISLWKQREEGKNAFQFILFSSLAGLLFLVFIGVLFVQTGMQSLELSHIKEMLASNIFHIQIIFYLALISTLILSALFPFHAWGPLGYSVAGRGVNTLLVGIIKKIGPYLLIRVVLELFPAELKAISAPLMILCLINIIYVGWVAMAQKDPKLMAGYSSSSHMGYILLGILSFSTIGLVGALVLAFAHGLVTSLLFANIGRIEEKTGAFKFGQIAGIGKQTPFLLFIFSVAALAGAGLPGLASFVGEVLILFSLVAVNKVIVAIAIFGVLLSAVYFLRAIKNIFHGETILPVSVSEIDDEKLSGKFASVILVIGLIIIGVLPLPFISFVSPNATQIISQIEMSLEAK